MCDEGGSSKRRKLGESSNEEKRFGQWSHLPPELMTHILAYLSFDEIAEIRLVCQTFNQCGKLLLNKEARRILHVTSAYINKMKAELPRGTQLWLNDDRHCQIKIENCWYWGVIRRSIRSLYTKYEPYINNGSSCFVAGKILDLANAMLISNAKNSYLVEEMTNLKLMAEIHFNEIITTGTMSIYSTGPTFAPQPSYPYSLLNNNYLVQPETLSSGCSYFPSQSAQVPRIGGALPTEVSSNTANTNAGLINVKAPGQNQMVNELNSKLEAHKMLIKAQKMLLEAQKTLFEAHKQTIRAEKLNVIDSQSQIN